MDKKEFLKYPTKPVEVSPNLKLNDLMSRMKFTGFQGRKLAEAFEIWSKMLKENKIVIWFGLAGAMVPAGMRKIISYLIKKRMVDVIVSTGANLYHDCVEVLGGKHYASFSSINDLELRRHKIDRIYDVLADEDKFYAVDKWIEKDFCNVLKDDYPYSSREILYLLGKRLYELKGDRDSILISAYRASVPLFSPALCDSSLGFSIMFANRRRGRKIIADELKEVHETSLITEKSKITGVIYIGGGVPKNFIQQTAVIASYSTRHDRSHNFAVQITTDLPVWGGLSGASFEEAQSWGKISKDAKKVVCHCDATIALPIIVNALSRKFKRYTRNVPAFDWSNELKIKFQKMDL
ncbi:MAG: deoxyhypusine synthase [Candidatus Bathyarchaeia archaeon]